MTDLTPCPPKDALVTYLYEEDDSASRKALEAHLAVCVACREEASGLLDVRSRLADWTVPELDAHVTLVANDAANARPPWAWLVRPAFALPAAAMLVLGLAAGLANLEVRREPGGLVVRTGWAERRPTAEGRSPARQPGPVRMVETSQGSVAAMSAAPWRQDLAALERQLRQEFLSSPMRSTALSASGGAAGGRAVDPALLRQIQALLDESEVRQQRNLALRIAELSRDFDLQRQADLVQIQQGLGRLEGRTEAEAARARELMNYIVRVSQGQGQPR